MNLRPTHRVGGYGFLVIAGLTAALVAGRPEPAILAAPFAIFLVIGLAMGAPPALAVRFAVDRDRSVEGDRVTLTVSTPNTGLEIAPIVPSGLVVVDQQATPTSRTLVLEATRWGAFDLGTAAVRAGDPLRLWWSEAILSSRVLLRVHPAPDRLRRAVTPAELQRFVGNHTSRARGEGFDFADLRRYAIGDRSGSVNWRASARRGALWVNDRHPDRTGDVVLLLDTFGTRGDERVVVLDHAVRTLTELAQAYERTHDRVGLLTFGGHLRWLRPGSGRTNLARIVDAMLDTERLLSNTWENTLRVPIGALPPRALLLAVTSLDNDTTLHILVDLRARGFDVAVLSDTSAVVATSERAARLDALLRDARRRRLERFGVALADLGAGVPAAVEEVNAWRRRVPRLHA